MTSPLVNVRCFKIEVSKLYQTIEVLQKAGRDGFEAFVVWGGRVSENGREVRFDSVLVPPQTGHKTPEGLLVTVEGSALFEVNRRLYQSGELLAGQVHSHPTEAFHSGPDDHNPLATLTGALSLVIPDFGRHAPDDIDKWAWYRLVGTGRWARLTGEDNIVIAPDGDL